MESLLCLRFYDIKIHDILLFRFAFLYPIRFLDPEQDPIRWTNGSSFNSMLRLKVKAALSMRFAMPMYFIWLNHSSILANAPFINFARTNTSNFYFFIDIKDKILIISSKGTLWTKAILVSTYIFCILWEFGTKATSISIF